MLLGFKRRFAPFVEEGSKTHTIRGLRKRPPRVGDMCHCYVDPRQKTMRLLGRWPCVSVERIEIEGGWETVSGEFFGSVQIDGSRLDWDEMNALAWRDGFRSQGQERAFAEMADFWRGRLPFQGWVIHWKWSKSA
jgi:hypothetical protein